MPYAILIAASHGPSVVARAWTSRGPVCPICGGVTFLAMAVTRNAGGGIHHTVLVWPMPQLLVGSVFGALPWRWLRVGLVAFLVGANLLVVNQYIVQFERNGSEGVLPMP